MVPVVVDSCRLQRAPSRRETDWPPLGKKKGSEEITGGFSFGISRDRSCGEMSMKKEKNRAPKEIIIARVISATFEALQFPFDLSVQIVRC